MKKYILILGFGMYSTLSLANWGPIDDEPKASGLKFELKYGGSFNGTSFTEVSTSDSNGLEAIQTHIARGNKCLAGITDAVNEIRDRSDGDHTNIGRITINYHEARRTANQRTSGNVGNQNGRNTTIQAIDVNGTLSISISDDEDASQLKGTGKPLHNPTEADCKAAVNELVGKIQISSKNATTNRQKANGVTRAFAQ